MSRFPLRYARRNILIGPRGEAAALYRADTVAYPFLPTSQKWALLHRLERFAHLAGADFALWRVQRSFAAERYPDELADLLDPEHGDSKVWRRYLKGHEARLRELGSQVPEVYVAISLSEGEGGPSALRSFGHLRRRVEELVGVGGPRPISGSELEALAAVERRTFDRLSGAVALQRASTRELQWLLRRTACRGMAEPALDRQWEPDALVVVAPDGSAAYEPLERDLWRCANAPATEDPGQPPSLAVEAEEGTSYQSFLCAGSLAEEAEFPGAAELLFEPTEGAGFPVDAVLCSVGTSRVSPPPAGPPRREGQPRRRARGEGPSFAPRPAARPLQARSPERPPGRGARRSGGARRERTDDLGRAPRLAGVPAPLPRQRRCLSDPLREGRRARWLSARSAGAGLRGS